MKKLSIPNFPLLICAITGSFLYSIHFFFCSISTFYSIYKCFSPGVLIECSRISSVIPIFKFIKRILFSLLSSMGGSTSWSTTSLTYEIVIPLILLISFCFIFFPIYVLMNFFCSWGVRSPSLIYLFYTFSTNLFILSFLDSE